MVPLLYHVPVIVLLREKTPAESDPIMTTSKKAVRTQHVVDPTLVAQAAGLASALPTADAPSPPATFDPAAKGSLGRGLNPRYAQVEIAPNVASELLKNSSQYTQQFGDAVPAPGDIADALTLAHGWSAKVRNAEQWQVYARYQEQLAWRHAFSLTDQLEPAYSARRASTPALANQYPSLSQFFDYPKQSAAKAVATRKANRDAKAKGASTSASSTAADATASTVATEAVKTV
jgi:hypothetical protein